MARGTWQGSGTWKTTSGGGGGGLVLVILAVLAIGSGAASAAVSALITILIITGSIIGIAIAGLAGTLIWRARSDRPGAPITARPVPRLPPDQTPRLEETSKAALEPPREIHLHLNVSPDQLAAILRHYTEEP